MAECPKAGERLATSASCCPYSSVGVEAMEKAVHEAGQFLEKAQFGTGHQENVGESRNDGGAMPMLMMGAVKGLGLSKDKE